MQRVGRVLLPRAPGVLPALRPLLAVDVFDAADADAAARLRPLATRLGAIDAVDALGGATAPWLQSYAVLQGAEIRATLGPWLAAHRPRLGEAIAGRFAGLAAIEDSEIAHWSGWRVEQARRLHALLAGGRVLVMPTTPGAALERDASPEARGRFYATALAVNAIAGHAGLPQVTLPLAALDGTPAGAPLGLSLVGAPGSDHVLLDFAVALAAGGEFPALA
jgi:amidase